MCYNPLHPFPLEMSLSSSARSSDYLISLNTTSGFRNAMNIVAEFDACMNTTQDNATSDETQFSVLADDATYCGNSNCRPDRDFSSVLPQLNAQLQLKDKNEAPFPLPSRDVCYTKETLLAAEFMFDFKKNV